MRRAIALLLSIPFFWSAGHAQEYIAVPDLISDAEFYRLVSCAAPPGGACGKPIMRWSPERRANLRVGLVGIDPAFPDYKVDLIDRAIDHAIEQINLIGADLTLVRAYPGEGGIDVPVYLVDTPQGGTVTGTGVPELDNASIAIARVALRSRGSQIQSVAIAISLDIRRRETASVVLEEMVQAMGLPTDISSPAYSHSIFSEHHNSRVWLRGQDAAALRRHYPHS